MVEVVQVVIEIGFAIGELVAMVILVLCVDSGRINSLLSMGIKFATRGVGAGICVVDWRSLSLVGGASMYF